MDGRRRTRSPPTSQDRQDRKFESSDFVDAVPGRFTCSICSDVLKGPHLTECCGQHFCRSCLMQWLTRSNHRQSCPHCRAERVCHMLNKALEREIDELQVYCFNRRKGCKWVGEKGALASHLQSSSGCKYEEVKCPNVKCGQKMERRRYTDHAESSCPWRQFSCQHCGKRDTFKAITEGDDAPSHYSQCPHYPLPCPNNCGETNIMRREVKLHCDSTCPLQNLRCPFADCGCTCRSIPRKDLKQHVSESVNRHMFCLLKSYQTLSKRLTQAVSGLNESIDDLDDRVSELEY